MKLARWVTRELVKRGTGSGATPASRANGQLLAGEARSGTSAPPFTVARGVRETRDCWRNASGLVGVSPAATR